MLYVYVPPATVLPIPVNLCIYVHYTATTWWIFSPTLPARVILFYTTSYTKVNLRVQYSAALYTDEYILLLPTRVNLFCYSLRWIICCATSQSRVPVTSESILIVLTCTRIHGQVILLLLTWGISYTGEYILFLPTLVCLPCYSLY